MDKNTGMILTAISIVFCACPGLAAICTGVMGVSTLAGLVIDEPIAEPEAFLGSAGFGVMSFICGLILIAIPVVLGIVTYRSSRVEGSSQ
jgi:hypothetical protein